jgi:hypothetical protein
MTVVLFVAWHLERGRDLPRAFRAARRLDLATRGTPGVVRVHRWISRRSVALETRWGGIESAEAWLASEAFARADADLGRLPGVRRVERLTDLEG